MCERNPDSDDGDDDGDDDDDDDGDDDGDDDHMCSGALMVHQL